MFKNLISLINQRPDLFADYLSAYTMLLREAIIKTRRRYIRRAMWFITAVTMGNASIIVSALAMMVWMNRPEFSLFKVLLIPGILVLLTVISILLVIYDREKHNELDRLGYQLNQDSEILSLLNETYEKA